MRMNTACFRRTGAMLALLVLVALPQAYAQQMPVPSLAGIWKLEEGAGGRARRPQSQWSTAELPFTEKGLELFNSLKPSKGPRGIDQSLSNDPVIHANPPGLYRALIYARVFEIMQQSNQLMQAFEWSKSWRAIYTDGRPVPNDIAAGPYWYGYSVGKWQGDTLVVDTLSLDDRAWLDEWGTPIGLDTRIQERWTRIAPDKMQMTFTVTDPEIYSRPWTSTPVIYALQKKGVEPQEIMIAPMDVTEFNNIRYGSDSPK
jgi:hypothetical protein